MRDGHIHTPYCPHGTKDSLKSYIEQAIELGYKTMTFTEHGPLPSSFDDPVPEKDSGMDLADVDSYLTEVNKLQEEYNGEILIKAGLEVDYIEGYEKETVELLEKYGPYLEDSILSVHFLKGKQQWYCIDYSPEMYQAALKDFGDQQSLYSAYFKSLIKSAEVDLGEFKPRRIGHMTLIRKFHKLFPSPAGWDTDAMKFLKLAQDRELELDYNGAGTQKPHCKETYPSHKLATQAFSMGIPLIYGSDAHKASGLKQGYRQIDPSLLKL